MDADLLMNLAAAVSVDLATKFPTATIGAQQTPIAFTWEANPEIDGRDQRLQKPLVITLDWAERLQSENGMDVEEFDLLTIVQMNLSAKVNEKTTVQALSALTAAIARFLRPRDESHAIEVNGEVVVCVKVSRSPARNIEEHKTNSRFYAEIISTWKAA